ncbi:ATP-binding protein [Haloparvum sedimenti]|uniref:ATP-binding protein n=1 Tax=Haloparvum sedimenti TaxID=1678448 RepID=UPI00071E71E7|nr:ATP-binding protein [Haloparvum sedimenti]
MILSIAAMSGWGKSYACQAITEMNTEVHSDAASYDHVVVLDFKDEYRGLCSKQHGPAPFQHWIAGPRERDHFRRKHWRELISENGNVVIARHQEAVDVDEWREICAIVAEVARPMGDVLIVIDEAHFVAPQSGKVPEPLVGLATTGRGEGASSAWVTQRPAKFEEDIWSLANARLLGAFDSDSDQNKIAGPIEYPKEVHIPGGESLGRLPDDLLADGDAVSLRKNSHVADDGTERVTDSEWVYSDDDGTRERFWSSSRWSPQCDHVGSPGKRIEVGL